MLRFFVLVLFLFKIAECGVVRNPELSPLLMEGDIMSPPQADGLTSNNRKWPKGVIPYIFEENYPELGMYQVQRAIRVIHDYTCVRYSIKLHCFGVFFIKKRFLADSKKKKTNEITL